MSTDLLTLAEAKAAISQENDFVDANEKLRGLISTVSERLDDACGPIVHRTLSEQHDGGKHTIWLKESPVASITSCMEYSGTTPTVLTVQTNLVHPTNAILLTKTHGTISRLSSGHPTYFATGSQNIEIVYVAGRFEKTEKVSDKFKDAAKLFLNHLWAIEYGMGTDTYGQYDGPVHVPTYALPNRVKDLLQRELRPGAVA